MRAATIRFVKLKPVSSRENAVYKRLKQLASSAQARKKEGLSLLDGAHLVGAHVAARGAPALMAVSESGLKRSEVQALVRQAAGEVLQLPDALFEGISSVEHGAGIVAAVLTPREALPPTVSGDCLLLEHLQDPGNMGSLLRTAAAAGVRQVFCSTHTVYAWSPKVLRAGQGAHFGLTIVEGVVLDEVIDRLTVPLVATSSHASASVFETDLAGPVAWLFGNEGAGVSPALLARAERKVMIPMPGGIESLNVAAAGAICMFEAVRQRRTGKKKA